MNVIHHTITETAMLQDQLNLLSSFLILHVLINRCTIVLIITML